MDCPHCNCTLHPWPWQDGGYKGVHCGACGGEWWSEKFAGAAYEAERAAVNGVIANMEFPDDALTQEQWEARVRGKAKP